MGSWGKMGEVWLSKSVSGVWVSCSKEYNGAELDELAIILEVNNGGVLDWKIFLHYWEIVHYNWSCLSMQLHHLNRKLWTRLEVL